MSTQRARVCLFPASGKQNSSLKRPLSTRVELERLDDLQQLLRQEHGIALLCAHLRATWALVLRCYAGTNDICFEVEELGLESSAESGKPSSAALWLSIDEDRTLHELVEAAGRDDALQFEHSSQTHRSNTALLIRYANPAHHDNPQNQTTSMAMAEQVRSIATVMFLTIVVPYPLAGQDAQGRRQHLPRISQCARANRACAQDLEHHDTILTNIMESPATRVREMDALSARNKMQLEKWNAFPLDQVDATIHGIFHDMVQKSPDAEAVCSWDGIMTYRQYVACAFPGKAK